MVCQAVRMTGRGTSRGGSSRRPNGPPPCRPLRISPFFLGHRDAAGVQCVFRRAGRGAGRGGQRASGKSRFMPSTITRYLDLLDEQREAIFHEVGPLPDAVLWYRPGPRVWSIGDASTTPSTTVGYVGSCPSISGRRRSSPGQIPYPQGRLRRSLQASRFPEEPRLDLGAEVHAATAGELGRPARSPTGRTRGPSALLHDA